MRAGRAWAIRNLGIDEAQIDVAAATVDDQSLRRELIEFDSEQPSAATAISLIEGTGMSKFVNIPWPKGFSPRPGTRPKGNSLPRCDVLIVTWTVEEGHALSKIM